jgi:hypothetical protein
MLHVCIRDDWVESVHARTHARRPSFVEIRGVRYGTNARNGRFALVSLCSLATYLSCALTYTTNHTMHAWQYTVYIWMVQSNTGVCFFSKKKKYVLVIYLFPVSGHISDDRYTCNGNVINRLIARQETDASLYTSWLWLIDTTKQLTWTDAYDKQFVVLHQQNCVLYNLITILLLVLIWGYNEDTMLILIIYTKKYKSYNPTQ